MKNSPLYKHNSAALPALSALTLAVRTSILSLGLASGASQAATIEVTTNVDDLTTNGNCTLREAIVSINTLGLQDSCINTGDALGTNDSITFSNSLSPPNNTITLGGSELVIASDKDISINASSISGGITVDANQLSRIFYTTSATLAIDRMTITNGSASFGGGISALSNSNVTISNSTLSNNFANGGGAVSAVISTVTLNSSMLSGNSAVSSDGGGIYANYTNVTLNGSTLSDNYAYEDGGAIYSRGSSVTPTSLTLNNSTLSGNSANDVGGGIYAFLPIVAINNSTLSGNSGTNDGGAIHARQSTLTVNSSTLSKNSTNNRGGGIVANDSSVTLNESTLSDNSAASDGGGISARTSSTVTLSNSTLSGNSSNMNGGGLSAILSSEVTLRNSTFSENFSDTDGGGLDVRNAGSSLTISNSIIANSLGGTDCKSVSIPVVTDTASIIANSSCITVARYGDPGLLPLANNGGPTQTHALEADSIARDTGIFSGATIPLENCTTNDQRGQLRDKGDGACDVGAIEYSSSGFYVIPSANGKVVVIPL